MRLVVCCSSTCFMIWIVLVAKWVDVVVMRLARVPVLVLVTVVVDAGVEEVVMEVVVLVDVAL